MLRQTAAQDAWISSEPVSQKLLADHLFSAEEFPGQGDPFDWLSNASGNTLISLAQPGYVNNLNRQADGVATLRLVATVLWLRQTHANGIPLAERLQQRPAWMRMAEDRHFGLSKDGRHLHMDYHHRQRSGADVTEWPLSAGL